MFIIYTVFLTSVIVKVGGSLQIINANIQDNTVNFNENNNEKYSNSEDKVNITLYYESLCPYCIDFLGNQLAPVAKKIAPYLDIHLIPYGNAKTSVLNKKYVFKCQHGPDECYGNKLHVCAIDALNNITAATIFNGCMITRRSNDEALEQCGNDMQVNTQEIWYCANSARGVQLLKNYGDQTRAINARYVPLVFINGKEVDGDERKDLLSVVCKLLQHPPNECS